MSDPSDDAAPTARGVDRGNRSARICSLTAATVLLAAGAVHVSWAFGRSWPADDRDRTASMFAGTDRVPGRAACLGVAGLLGAAAAVTAGAGGAHPLARSARAGVAGVLLLRGVAGLTGNTGRLVPWNPSDEFRQTDRRYYGPGCLAVAALVAAGRG
ncbi:MAG: DUF3995 domain-containing protein [Acidobacteriota bacterium]